MKNSISSIQEYEDHFTTKKYYINDILRGGDYLLKDDYKNLFILKNIDKNYEIGDVLKVYGSFYAVDFKYKNFKEFKNKQFLTLSTNLLNIKNFFEFNYTKYLMMKGISGIIYSKKTIKIDKNTLPFYKKIKKSIKNQIYNIYKKYDNDYKALILGIFIGDKSFLSDKMYENFINSGLVHIIVVSGGNIMFLTIFFGFVLFFIPFYIRLFLVGILIIVYSMVAGFDSSLIRASIMGILSLIALFFGKISDTRRILAIAFMLMLVYNPYFIFYDLGFILSFLAIGGILVFNKLKIAGKSYIKGLSYFYNNYVLPTVGASFFTAPAILLFTGKLNILAFVSSILIVPILPFLIIINVCLLLLFFLNLPYDFVLNISIMMINYIFYISSLFGDKFSYFINI